MFQKVKNPPPPGLQDEVDCLLSPARTTESG